MLLTHASKNDGVAKLPPYGVAAIFQDFDIPVYAFTPEKSLRLEGRKFCLAISVFNRDMYDLLVLNFLLSWN